MKSFQNKTAVITGAGSGLGRAFALNLNQAGAHLALCDLNMDGLEETRSLLSNKSLRTTLHTVDVYNHEQMQNFADEVIAQHEQADLLINNAGITLTPSTFEEITEEQFEKVINVNMWGVYRGVRAFLPHLRKSPEAGIINISSLAGLVGLPFYGPYVMSKFAVRGFSELLQCELSPTNISVLAVFPGGVKTNIIKNAPNLTDETRKASHSNFTKSATLTPEIAVTRILRALQRKKKRIVLGADARVTLAIRKLFPNRFASILHTIFSQANF